MATCNEAFDPVRCENINCTNVPVSIPLTSIGSSIRIRNYGPNRVFIARGRAGVVADTTGYPVEAYTADEIFRDINLHERISAVCENPGETAKISIVTGSDK